MDFRDILYLLAGFAVGYFAKTILAKAKAAFAKAHATEQALVEHLKADAAALEKKV